MGVWASNRRAAPKLAVLTTIVAAPHSKSGTRTRSAVYTVHAGDHFWVQGDQCRELLCWGDIGALALAADLGQVAAIRPRQCRHVGTTKGENSCILSVESGCGWAVGVAIGGRESCAGCDVHGRSATRHLNRSPQHACTRRTRRGVFLGACGRVRNGGWWRILFESARCVETKNGGPQQQQARLTQLTGPSVATS